MQVQNHLNRQTKTFKRVYAGDVVRALEQIWEIYGQICAKRLQPILPEAIRVLERCQEAVSKAIHLMRQRLPFPLLGIDSDNGSEFINDTLYRYCLDEKITFTRSRPYKKNDQANVEQKNWSVVRHTVGYDRWETQQEFAILESIYSDLRLYINFFQPSFKLIAKECIGKRTIKRYDPAKTPYQRVLERKDISVEAKARLINLYLQLNPAKLRRQIDLKIAKRWKISR